MKVSFLASRRIHNAGHLQSSRVFARMAATDWLLTVRFGG